MSKKDYEAAARIAREASSLAWHTAVVEAFVALFRSDNPRFDAERFRAACESKG